MFLFASRPGDLVMGFARGFSPFMFGNCEAFGRLPDRASSRGSGAGFSKQLDDVARIPPFERLQVRADHLFGGGWQCMQDMPSI